MAEKHETQEHPKAPAKAAEADPYESPEGGHYQQPQPGKVRTVRERTPEDEAHDKAVKDQDEQVEKLEREWAEKDQ